MIWWIVSTVLTSAAAILVSAPFIWRHAVRRSAAAYASKTQTDRIMPVENGGSLDPNETDGPQSTPIEIERPLLADDRAPEPAWSHFSKSARTWTLVATASGIFVFGTVGIYALSRDPSFFVDPLSANRDLLSSASQTTALRGNQQLFPKNSSPVDRLQELFAQYGTRVQGMPKASRGLPPVEELIEHLVARLQNNPKDFEGWRTLGWSYFNLRRFDEAATAYAKAIELNPNVAELHSARGEALVGAANGTVTAESKRAFGEALKRDSKELRARFFSGLAKAQAGDKAAALDDWIEVANDAGPNDSTIPALGQRIAELAKELDVDVTQRLHRPLATAVETTPGQSKSRDIGLMPHTMGQSSSKPNDANAPTAPADQSAMIRGMVDSLANRLEQSPHDVDGWIRLIRSRQVLNEPEAARQAFEHALKVFDEPSPERDRLVAAVKELGLSP